MSTPLVPTPEIEHFIERVVCGDYSAECRLQIANYAELYDALVWDLKKLGLSDFQVSEALWDCLSSVCPQCGRIIDGPQLAALGLLHRSDSPTAAIARTTATALRFGQGVCPNATCSCREFVLRWQLRTG